MTAFDGSVTVPAICAFCPQAERIDCENNQKITQRRSEVDRETLCAPMKQTLCRNGRLLFIERSLVSLLGCQLSSARRRFAKEKAARVFHWMRTESPLNYAVPRPYIKCELIRRLVG